MGARPGPTSGTPAPGRAGGVCCGLGRAGPGDDEVDEDEEESGRVLGGQGKPLNLREMPRYEPPAIAARDVIAPTIPDLRLLGILIAASLAVAFTIFPTLRRPSGLIRGATGSVRRGLLT